MVGAGSVVTSPIPDNVVAVTKKDPFYTLTATARFQANNFFDTTERLPDIALDIKRHALFGGPIFYEGETSFADLRLQFAKDSGFENYGTTRLDTFHQLLYPNTYFGWLSIVPRVGFRTTYYGDTRDLGKTMFTPDPNPLVPDFLLPNPTLANPIAFGGDTFRTVFNTGAEASFKVSRTWENVQSRALGLDVFPCTRDKLFICLRKWCGSEIDLAIRSIPTFYATAGNRLPSVHSNRFDR